MILCVTGHRPQNFPWDYENDPRTPLYLSKLNQAVLNFISEGYSDFISGGAIGVDSDFAEAVLAAKKQFPHITLEIIVPCGNQDLKWREKDRLHYRTLLSQADHVTPLFEHYTPQCMQKRNEFMVDKSDTVFAVWNGIKKGGTWNTIHYAHRSEKPVVSLMLNEIQLP